MRVYVEANFVLELALEQEQHASCEELLLLAESRRIDLVLPAYSLVEPYETLRRRHLDRETLKRGLDRELRQMSRSAGARERVARFQAVTDLLLDSAVEESRRLERLRSRLTEACELIPLDEDCLVGAVVYRTAWDFSPQDAIVCTSVIFDLEEVDPPESCFLNRDAKHFSDPDLIEIFQQRRCRVILSFEDGLNFVRSRLAAADERS